MVLLGVSTCFLGYLITLEHPVCCRTKGRALFWYLYSSLYPEYLKINFNAFEITNCSLSSFNSSLLYPPPFNLRSSVLPKPQQTLIFLSQRGKWIPEWRDTLARTSPQDKPVPPCQPAAAEHPTATQFPSRVLLSIIGVLEEANPNPRLPPARRGTDAGGGSAERGLNLGLRLELDLGLL